MTAAWRVSVDIGGTFTDLAAWKHDSGHITRAKVLTVPDEPVRGVIAAIEKAGIVLGETSMFVHGSTVAINAVLQGTGARTALLTTRGFRDVLEMGRKNRPDMYNLFFKPPPCPVPREHRLEIDERLAATGDVLEAINEEQVATTVASLPPEIEAIAICFIHAYANLDHERRAAEVVRNTRPEVYVCASTDLSGEAREYERTCTAVTNAYVGPLVGTYVAQLAGHLKRSGCTAPLLITQSNGGVMTSDVAVRQPVRTMESGPAAGVTGAAWLGTGLHLQDLIAFDMGGTSAKACVVQHGEPEAATEYYIGGRRHGLPVQVPFLDIVEVGAGGGSVAYVDAGQALRVGPRSAGSVPGPAAYGLGGNEPTITDANVVMGRIDPDYFLGGEMPLRADRASRAVGALAAQLGMDLEDCAGGIIRIADAIMAGAIRTVTVERGRDPRDFTLVAYGGAGPLHATSLAAELRIPRVLIPSGSGTHGAFGMLVTDIRHDAARTVHRRLDDFAEAEMMSMFATLEAEAAQYVVTELGGDTNATAQFTHRLDLRYVGQFHPLTLTLPAQRADIQQLFHAAHLERYGHNAPAEPIEVTALRATAALNLVKPPSSSPAVGRAPEGSPKRSRRVMFDDGTWHDCKVSRRHELNLGQTIAGPAIVEDADTNIVLRPSDQAEVLEGGHVMITVGGLTA
jgi:N-methylhydantoinase A